MKNCKYGGEGLLPVGSAGIAVAPERGCAAPVGLFPPSEHSPCMSCPTKEPLPNSGFDSCLVNGGLSHQERCAWPAVPLGLQRVAAGYRGCFPRCCGMGYSGLIDSKNRDVCVRF